MSRVYPSKSNIHSGSYTPNVTLVVGIDSVTFPYNEWKYSKVGSIVQVFGVADVNPSATNSAFEFRFSLPITSDFIYISDAAGSGATTRGEALSIEANTVNNEVSVKGKFPFDVTTRTTFSFNYEIK